MRLGLVAFGLPFAHLGYFRKEFVERHRWLDDAACADLLVVTICARGGTLLGAWL